MKTMQYMYQRSVVFLSSLMLLHQGQHVHGMLDPNVTPTSPSLSVSDANLLHKLLMQESSMRMELEKQITNLQNTVISIQKDLAQKDAEIAGLKTTQKASGSSVAFSAYLSHNLENVPNGQVIKFDKIFVNLGNGYSTASGIFRAPVAGVYQFSLTIGGNVVNTHTNVIHNGHVVGHLYADHFNTGQYGRASLTLALHLAEGDEVWNVDPDGQIHQVIIGSYGTMPISVFTGHLIAAD